LGIFFDEGVCHECEASRIRLAILHHLESGGLCEGTRRASCDNQGRRFCHPARDLHYRTVGDSVGADPLDDIASLFHFSLTQRN
jgi:hypothetical protein